MPPLLSIENLEVVLRDRIQNRTGSIIRGLSLTISTGECLALVGESGCGKSMTALSILNLLPSPPMEIRAGNIVFKDKSLRDMTEPDWVNLRGKEIGIVFQEPASSLNPVMRVGLQIGEVLRQHSDLPAEKISERVHELLANVGLTDPERIAGQYPHQLSGGMCQRVMLAMAFACGPSLLIADEPTTALDATVQAQILDLLFKMKEQLRLSVLFITHDLRVVRNHADRVAILYAGQVVEEGPPDELFGRPQHPYTEGLLDALPEYSHKGHPLVSIKGSVPSPFTNTVGCVFADRCSRVEASCRESEPELVEKSKGHWVRCYYPSKK